VTTSLRPAAGEGLSDDEAPPVAARQAGDWRWPLLAYALVFLALAARFLPQLASSVPLNRNIEDAHVCHGFWPGSRTRSPSIRVGCSRRTSPIRAAAAHGHRSAVRGAAAVRARVRRDVQSSAVGESHRSAQLSARRAGDGAAAAALRDLAEIAWLAGLVFALGVLRVPFNLNELAYPNVLLPWIALALTRLRDEPSLRRAGALLLAFTIASSRASTPRSWSVCWLPSGGRSSWCVATAAGRASSPMRSRRRSSP